MSIPPQLIRVKRKRVEEAPVTFLQFDQDSKRHLSGRNWAYQRRETTASQTAPPDTKSTRPVIHVSTPDQVRNLHKAPNHGKASREPEPLARDKTGHAEPRRFRVSRAMLAKRAVNQNHGAGVASKKLRYGPAVFIESTRKDAASRPKRRLTADQPPEQVASPTAAPHPAAQETVVEQRQLKRPGVACRGGSAATARQPQPTHRTPLPDSFTSRHDEDMDRIARDMNQWVLNELGANLQSMEQDKRPLRFKPKSPAKRYHERHPEQAQAGQAPRVPQVGLGRHEPSDDEDDDDDDEWVIEEYVRIPAHSVAADALSTDIGILVLEDDEESNLFFGSTPDEDDEFGEDDEDENAENHYTADYPEDEVDSDDEYDRQAYMYRHGNNSDEEEFDDAVYEEQDDMVLEGHADDDDDARMARIKDFMRRHPAFR
ncbi:hypothetical protein E4U42_000485 [Claviceps africana]|uniref:Transcription factor Iwr1 domain-containing protein n=1 Tax=Claviceps africana TaxID=83212 RepID=A0A8K0J2H2_9HYPO|nr:hypothetical protein E4U42_000485 [Claviceps africana]